MPWCLCGAVGVPGGCSLMMCRAGSRLSGLSGRGNSRECGNGGRRRCGEICAPLLGEKPNRARPCWRVHQSKPVPFVAMRVAPMGGKKMQGRNRHRLVDTLGVLILVNVLAATITDREGANVLLLARVGKPPRLLLLWAESASQGTFEDGVKGPLEGVRVDIVNPHGLASRGRTLRSARTWTGFSPQETVPRGLRQQMVQQGCGRQSYRFRRAGEVRSRMRALREPAICEELSLRSSNAGSQNGLYY